MNKLAALAMMLLVTTAYAAPVVIPGDNYCPNCASSNDDYTRYLRDAQNCAMGSYTAGPCATAHSKFWKQYTQANNIGIRIRECSTLTGPPGGYGCVNVDLYWQFDVVLTQSQLIPWAMDVMLDYHYSQPFPPFAVVKGLNVTMVSTDGTPHDTHYNSNQIPVNDANIPTYPPQGPAYVCPHPLAQSCNCSQSQISPEASCPAPPTGMHLSGCANNWDFYWSPEPRSQVQRRQGGSILPMYDGPLNKILFTITGGTWDIYVRDCDDDMCSAWAYGGFAYPGAYCQ